MGTFDVIGKNFQLGLSIDRGFIVEEYVVILLESIGFLCRLIDVDFTVEYFN